MRLKSLLMGIMLLALTAPAFSATTPVITLGNSITTTAGKISIPVILTTNGAAISLLAFNISYDPAKLSNPSGVIGAAASSAGKALYDNICKDNTQLGCSATGIPNTPGNYKALVVGDNNIGGRTTLTDGVIATITFDGILNNSITLTSSATDANATSDTALAPNNAANLQISLKRGWNLISLPVQQAQTAVGAILSTLSYNKVWGYSGANWLLYDPADPDFSDLTAMTAGAGYWIYMSNPVTFQVRGSIAASIPLNAGWNLVGYAAISPANTTAATSGISTKLEKVWGYSNGSWLLYDPADPDFSDLTTLEPGNGYWLKMKEAATWAIQ